MKLREVAKQLVEQFNLNEGAAVVPFTEGADWESLKDVSTSHAVVKGASLPEAMVRAYLWEMRKQIDPLKKGGGIWASRLEEPPSVVIGLCELQLKEVASG